MYKFLLLSILLYSYINVSNDQITTIYLIGDSTMADYSNNYDEGKDYFKTRYPLTGWGQVFQDVLDNKGISEISNLIKTDSVVVDDRARGGRSTRTFFQEGRWRNVYDGLKKNDLVIMQFGHNDAAESKPLRYVDIEGYKEFLRLYVNQSREKGAIPIILTPVCRNYPWENGQLKNVHGDYPNAALEIAEEMNVHFLDLNIMSMQAFSEKGVDYVTDNYFMNLPAGIYNAYPDGETDNTHFQTEGAQVIAELIYEGLKNLGN